VTYEKCPWRESLRRQPSPIPTKTFPVHYGWIIAATGVLVLFSCIGLGRFGFTVLIPGMQADLQLSYQKLGFIGTSNFFGYLVAVFFAPGLIKRLRPRAVIVAGLMLIGLSMVSIGRAQEFAAVCLLYTLTGLGTGFANIPMMTLTTTWFDRARRGRAAGLVICGNGLGIIFVGFTIPLCTDFFGSAGWRVSWLILGGLSLAIAFIAGLLLRNDPAEMGLEPVGSGKAGEGGLPAASTASGGERRGFLLSLGILYLVYGATFMIYGTFIVTTMVNDYGFDEKSAGVYWSWVGFFSLFSGISFGVLSDRIGRKCGLMAVFGVQTMCYLLVGLHLGRAALTISIILYGLSVFAAPAIVTAAIGDNYRPSRVARAFSNATFFFAFGQTIGPALAGYIGGGAENFATAYLVAAVLTALAGVWSLRLPGPAARQESPSG
jgi:sugar phosphate permease